MSSAIKVLFCNQTASPIGGVETWLDQLCARLDPARWRPIVALVRGASAHDPDRFRAHHPDLETVEIDGGGLPPDSRIRAVMRCVTRVEPQIFIPLVVSDAHRAACVLRSRSDRCRYLLNLQGNSPLQLVEASEHQNYADFAVVPGRLTGRLLQEAGMPRDRVRYIPNGASDVSRTRTLRHDNAPIRLCYAGRFAQEDKRVRDLVAIAQALQIRGVPFHLTIAGEGCERTFLERGLRDMPVTFRGSLDRQILFDTVYAESDVLLLTSVSESFGISIIEAMRHGVVPVTSQFSGLQAEGLVQPDVTGLVFPVGDAEQAAAQIEKLSSDQSLLDRLSAAARKMTESRFSWDCCIQGWDEALGEALEISPRQAPSGPPPPVPRPIGWGERLRLPAGVLDTVRRARVGVLGVPDHMLHGEEWPWIYSHHEPSAIKRFERAAVSLDVATATELVP